jgi:hypothetical protein
MAYGIQVFNTSAGTIQIDQDYRNLFYNRTVYYSDSASLLTILNSLGEDEFPVYDITTVGNFYPVQYGYLTIFKTYTNVISAGYGLTVYKSDGSIAYSNLGRPLETIGDTEYIWNSFVFPSPQYLNLYLPEPRPGKVRNIIFSLMAGDWSIYNYNTFGKGFHPWFSEGEFYISSSISGGIQHLQMWFTQPANNFLIVAIIDG